MERHSHLPCRGITTIRRIVALLTRLILLALNLSACSQRMPGAALTPITTATVPTEVNNLTAEKQVPDFLDYLYLDGLQAVKPEAANIIR